MTAQSKTENVSSTVEPSNLDANVNNKNQKTDNSAAIHSMPKLEPELEVRSPIKSRHHPEKDVIHLGTP